MARLVRGRYSRSVVGMTLAALLFVGLIPIGCSNRSEEQTREGIHIQKYPGDPEIERIVTSIADEVHLFRLEGDLSGMTIRFSTYENGGEPQAVSMPAELSSESDEPGHVVILLARNSIETECGQWSEYTFGRVGGAGASTSSFVRQTPADLRGGFSAWSDDEYSQPDQVHALYVRARTSEGAFTASWSSGVSTEEQRAQLQNLVDRAEWVEVLEIMP